MPCRAQSCNRFHVLFKKNECGAQHKALLVPECVFPLHVRRCYASNRKQPNLPVAGQQRLDIKVRLVLQHDDVRGRHCLGQDGRELKA